MTVFHKVKKPFSPGPRLTGLFNLLRSPRLVWGKEAHLRRPPREKASGRVLHKEDQPPPCDVLDVAIGPPFSSSSKPICEGGVAIQSEDTSNEAIVITTLPSTPFVDHAALIGMDRSALVNTATELNARLPAALQIHIDEEKSSTYIRNSIELIVGLRGPVPVQVYQQMTGLVAPSVAPPVVDPVVVVTKTTIAPFTPKHARSKSFDPSVLQHLPPPWVLSPPNTPKRNSLPPPSNPSSHGALGTSFGLYYGNTSAYGLHHGPILEILEEASDEDMEPRDSLHARPQKKRRINADGLIERMSNLEKTPTPAVRTGTRPLHRRTASEHCAPTVHRELPTPVHLHLNSRQTALPLITRDERIRGAVTGIDLAFLHAPNIRIRPKPKLGLTSTPKKVVLLPLVTAARGTSALRQQVTKVPPIPNAQFGLLKRKASVLDEEELTFGLDGMTISPATSLLENMMDVSYN